MENETIGLAVLDFRHEIEPETRRKIVEFRREATIEEKTAPRIEYLTGKIDEWVGRAWYFYNAYEREKLRDSTINRLWTGRKLREAVKMLAKLQTTIFYLKRREGDMERTDIQSAKEFPILNLYEFKKNMAVCPFHPDKDPSMSYNPKTNKAHCFSCNKTWDSIDFLMELEGLSFNEAVRRLQ
jgi:hypothetical protein